MKRHPTIEDNVIIYAGASILGGETVIGRGAVIGSNAFITSSIEPGARVSIKKPGAFHQNRRAKGACGQRDGDGSELVLRNIIL